MFPAGSLGEWSVRTYIIVCGLLALAYIKRTCAMCCLAKKSTPSLVRKTRWYNERVHLFQSWKKNSWSHCHFSSYFQRPDQNSKSPSKGITRVSVSPVHHAHYVQINEISRKILDNQSVQKLQSIYVVLYVTIRVEVGVIYKHTFERRGKKIQYNAVIAIMVGDHKYSKFNSNFVKLIYNI